MKSHGHDQSKNRRWSRTTCNTYMLSVRMPYDLAMKLKQYVDYTGESASGTANKAIAQYLEQHSPMERLQEGGSEG